MKKKYKRIMTKKDPFLIVHKPQDVQWSEPPKDKCTSCDKEIQWPWYLCADCLDVLVDKKKTDYWSIKSVGPKEGYEQQVAVTINEDKSNHRTQD